jgi:hypothetical protein
MKKILLISYYFPPGNFAGSYRVKSWADHLHKFGYYPIIVTRHWDDNDTDYTAISRQNDVSVEEGKTFTVYRLPYKGTQRDKLVAKYGNIAKFPGKILSFFQLLCQNFSLACNPMSGLYRFSREYLINNPDVELVMCSGRPFIQFQFCNSLKKEFPRIKWVADYRDEWNSQPKEFFKTRSVTFRFLSFIESRYERKWVKSASLITTVSEEIRRRIVAFNHFKGNSQVLLNGYESDDFPEKIWKKLPDPSKFRIFHGGSLYTYQEIDVFVSGISKFLEAVKGKEGSVELIFEGLNDDPEIHSWLLSKFRDLHIHITIHPRTEKLEYLSRMRNAHVLLVFPYNALKGTYSSKIFEYLPAGRPVLMAPSDDGTITKLLQETNTGFVADDADAVCDFLLSKFKAFINGTFSLSAPGERVNFYSREKQTKIMAEAIDKLLD